MQNASNNPPVIKDDFQQKKEDALREQYEGWRVHPLTQHLIGKLEAHKGKFISSLSANSYNLSIDDKVFRIDAHAIKTIDAILTYIKTQEQFIQ